MEINNLIDRKQVLRIASPSAHVKQRLAQAADELNRAGALAMRVELANEALATLTRLLYERDADGELANVDSVGYRLRVPAPWGAAGWQHWGLREWEGRALRRILHQRQQRRQAGALWTRQRPPLFVYDGDERRWYLNWHDYPSFDAALYWLKHERITLQEWRQTGKQYGRG